MITAIHPLSYANAARAFFRNDRFGLTTAVRVPGAGELMLYQAKHPTAYDR